MRVKDVVQKIRHSSREMVRELGLLSNDCNFNLSIPLTHILIELDLHGPLSQIDLAEKLNLNKSSISRAIQKLIQQRFVNTSVIAEDQRYKRCALTADGKKLVNKIHQNANQQVEAALLQMSDAEKEVAIAGLDVYAKALKRSRILNEFSIRQIQSNDNFDLMMVIKTVLREYGADRPGFVFVDPELENMYKAYFKKKAAYFVIERKRDKKIIGGAGFSRLLGGDKEICELQKMYLLPEFRSYGLGRFLIHTIIKTAKALGYKKCYLETVKSMERANYLYKSFGFTSLDKPLGNTGHYGCDAWYIRYL